MWWKLKFLLIPKSNLIYRIQPSTLAVSRTIGDEVAKSVGVEHSPEIIETTLTGNEQFIVVASDGIWEFLSNDKVKELVMPYYLNNKPNEACEKLIHEASLAWDRDGSARDDITCIVYFFPKKWKIF